MFSVSTPVSPSLNSISVFISPLLFFLLFLRLFLLCPLFSPTLSMLALLCVRPDKAPLLIPSRFVLPLVPHLASQPASQPASQSVWEEEEEEEEEEEGTVIPPPLGGVMASQLISNARQDGWMNEQWEW
ncbi:hypothetical protein E2C01_064499 [Portunus trituberculatus]|uniref:Uncharacterized protein n=1 Tax=Portunus trituberculatus TaxID=210409 RepID=A0A5B7HLY6_PORTR|nr:hypothetical protein [Portunus trituberculatus]